MDNDKVRKVRHGARLFIVINGKPVGRLTGFNPNENSDIIPIYGIGNFHPRELPHTRWSGNFTASAFVVEKEKVSEIGDIGTLGISVEQYVKNLLMSEGFDIAVEDKYTKEVVISFVGCKINSKSYNISENAIVMKNVSGMYLEPMQEA